MAFNAEKAKVQEHAQWRSPVVIAHWNVNHAPRVEGAGAAIPDWRPDECITALRQELSEEEEKLHGCLARAAKKREHATWKKFKGATLPTVVADTRWVLTWKMVEWKRDVKSRPVAKGNQDPDLKDSLAEPSGCLGIPSSHPPAPSLSALTERKT